MKSKMCCIKQIFLRETANPEQQFFFASSFIFYTYGFIVTLTNKYGFHAPFSRKNIETLPADTAIEAEDQKS